MPSATSSHLSSQPAAKKPPKSPETVLAEAEAQWIFTEAELAQTPSIADGMPVETERELRTKGLNFILQVGIMLKMPQMMLSTAGVFFNRFLMRHSMQKTAENPKPLHHYQIAATSLFLATKTEENIRRLRDLIVSCCRVAQKDHALVIDEQSKDYWRWRDTLLMNEDVLLEALCFDLTVESPHKVLFDMLKTLGLEHNKSLRNAAWSFVNDGGLTVICLLHTSKTIAAAGLYCGARYSKTDLPAENSEQPWWKQVGVKLRDVQKACNFMAELYEKNESGKAAEQNIYVGLRTVLVDDQDDAEDEEDGELIEDDAAAAATDDDDHKPPKAESQQTPQSPGEWTGPARSDRGPGRSVSPRGVKRERDDGKDGDASEEGELDE